MCLCAFPALQTCSLEMRKFMSRSHQGQNFSQICFSRCFLSCQKITFKLKLFQMMMKSCLWLQQIYAEKEDLLVWVGCIKCSSYTHLPLQFTPTLCTVLCTSQGEENHILLRNLQKCSAGIQLWRAL